MNQDTLKLLAPFVFVIAWLEFSLHNRSKYLILATLFFTSLVAFSQNFVFIYREIHQGIQMVLILFSVRTLIKSKKILKFNRLFLIFLILIGISFIFSRFDEDARIQLVNLVVAITVTNFLYGSLNSVSRIKVVLKFIARITIILSIIGLIEYAAISSERIEGTFANPNYYAFFLGIGYCFVFYSNKGVAKNLSLILILTAIVLSGSRAGLAFPLLQMIWHIYKSNNLKGFIVYGICGSIVALGIAGSGVTRFSDASNSSEGSDAERIIFTRIAFQMAADHPFTGVGWGRYISEFKNYSSNSEQIATSSGVIDASEQERRVTHNDLTRILAELGWIAFILSLISLIVGLLNIIRNKNSEMEYILPLWLGTVIFSLTHNNLNSALFWFIFLMPFHFFSINKVDKL